MEREGWYRAVAQGGLNVVFKEGKFLVISVVD